MKYAINKEFGLYRKFKPPINRFALRLAKLALSVMPKGMHSSKLLKIQRVKVPCSDGKKIKLYVIRKKGEEGNVPVIFNIHGGGFVFKGSPHHYKLAKQYALQTGAAVVYVDYRLAFDNAYGVTLADCVTAYKFITEHAEQFNLGKEIILAGDSAGGYLSVALTKECAQQNLSMPIAELLVYPAADPDMTTQSMQAYPDTPMWNATNNRKMWPIYSRGNAVYNPLQDDLSFMPMTYIETAEYDCLHDEGVMLYERILECGGQAELYQTKGTMHGYDIKLKAPTTVQSVDKRIRFLNDILQKKQ